MRAAENRFVMGVFVMALVSTMCIGARPAAGAQSPAAGASEATTENALAEVMAIPNRFDRNAALYRFIPDADRQRIEALLAALDRESGSPQRDDVARVLYLRFASLEPGAAVAHALGNYAKPQILETVFRAWAHVDLEAAVARASTLSMLMKEDAARAILDLDLSASERASIAERLGTRANLVEIEPPAPLRAAEPYDQALARIAAVEDARARYREIISVSAAWAAEDAAGAMAAILGWDGDKDLKGLWLSRVMGAWSDAEPRAAVDWLLTQDQLEVASLAGSAFASLAKTDLAEAQSLVQALPDGPARREAELGVFAAILEEGELDLALAAFDDLDLQNRQRYASGVGRRLVREDPARAAAWVMGLDEPVRTNTLPWVFASIHGADPELALRLVEDVDEPLLRIEAAYGLFTSGDIPEPVEALRWVRSLGSEAETATLVARIFTVWSVRDPPAAVDAVLEHPAGAVRDRALQSMMAARLMNFDPDTAERLLNAIDSPTEKSKAAARLRAYRDTEDGSDGRSP